MSDIMVSIKKKFRQGVVLIDSKNSYEIEQGEKIIGELVKDHPKITDIRAVYANFLYEKGDIDFAIKELREGILVSPKSEILSLSLYHILWESGKEFDAIKEIERLTTQGVECKDYGGILLEINEKWSKPFLRIPENEIASRKLEEKKQAWVLVKSILHKFEFDKQR